MHILPGLTILLCVVPCCVTRSIKLHIDSNRSDLRALVTNANIGGVGNDTLRRPWNHRGTTATDRRQMTDRNIEHKTRSRSHTDRNTNSNILSNVNPEMSGQRRTNSNMGRDTNRSDNVVEGNITNYSVQSGVKHGTSSNDSTKKKRDEGPNETIHATKKGGRSRPQGEHKGVHNSVPKGVHNGVHQKPFHETPSSHTWPSVGYSVLLLLGFILVLFCMVCVLVKCPTRLESVSDSQREIRSSAVGV